MGYSCGTHEDESSSYSSVITAVVGDFSGAERNECEPGIYISRLLQPEKAYVQKHDARGYQANGL